MFLNFDLKKIDTSGLLYKDDGQIISSKIENGNIINSNIVFTKPYKIQIRAAKMINGKRFQKKLIETFSPDTTLLEAIKKSSKKYEEIMNTLGIEKYVKQDFHKNMSFDEVYNMYLEYKKEQYASRNDKSHFRTKVINGFYNKWLMPIKDKAIGMIDEEDIQNIISNMKKQGSAERTTRGVYELVNPVFKYFNMKGAKFGLYLPSPALKRDLPPLNNERGLELSLEEIKELFIELKNYPVSPVREIFMFLMHGRRFNEVVTLKWEDINFEENTYTIRTLNNKARVDMTYHLSKRLRESLEALSMNKVEYIFTKLNRKEPYSGSSIRNHWKDKPIIIHQIRNCIATYLKNKMGVGDDVAGAILGHKQNKTITSRYGKINYYSFGKVLDDMLDDIFDEKTILDIEIEKINQLKVIFPDKDENELIKIINLLQ